MSDPDAPYREMPLSPPTPPPPAAGEVVWPFALMIALGVAMLAAPIGVGVFPATMRLAAPVVCPRATSRVMVMLEEVTDSEGTGTQPSLWCVAPDGVRRRAGDFPVVGALFAEYAASLWAALMLVARARKSARRRSTLALLGVLSIAVSTGSAGGTVDESGLKRVTRGYCHSTRGIQHALGDLRQRVGGPLRARSMTLYGEVVMADLASPAHPEDLDAWRWSTSSATGRSFIEDPSPVHTDARALDLLDVSSFHVERMDAMAAQCLGAIPLAGGWIQTVTLQRGPQGEEFSFAWTSTRRSATVRFDANGRLLEVRVH